MEIHSDKIAAIFIKMFNDPNSVMTIVTIIGRMMSVGNK